MPNVTKKSLLAAGVAPDHWDRAKKVCNTQAYKVKRTPHRAEGGPLSTARTGCPIWLDDAQTAPITASGEVGYYKRVSDAIGTGASCKAWGIVAWVDLS